MPLAGSVLATSVDNGADREDPDDEVVVTRASSACSSCHDGSIARAHMESNGGNFTISQFAIDGGEVIEQCEVCHDSGRSHDVAEVHNLD